MAIYKLGEKKMWKKWTVGSSDLQDCLFEPYRMEWSQ